MIKKILYILFLISLGVSETYAQSQWKFYVAFEDATGQKDTIWMIYDTTATNYVDSTLGEGQVQFDYSKFNVFLYNQVGDSTKTKANPYSDFPVFSALVRAFNVQYPLTISWDTSLFNSVLLPIQPNLFFNRAYLFNDYFNWNNNDINLQAYNMLIDDYAFAPPYTWGSREHFPLSIHFLYDPTSGIKKSDMFTDEMICPNPCKTFTKISTNKYIKKLLILDFNGKSVQEYQFTDRVILENYFLDVGNLSEGSYIFSFIYFDNSFSNRLITIFK